MNTLRATERKALAIRRESNLVCNVAVWFHFAVRAMDPGGPQREQAPNAKVRKQDCLPYPKVNVKLNAP